MNQNQLNESVNEHDGIFECPVCGFHYRDASLAQECAEECGGTKSCNRGIRAQSVECESSKEEY